MYWVQSVRLVRLEWPVVRARLALTMPVQMAMAWTRPVPLQLTCWLPMRLQKPPLPHP